MNFEVIERRGDTPEKSKVYLRSDKWNDFGYTTLYGVIFVDDKGIKHRIGGVRIAYVDIKQGTRPLEVGTNFNRLEDNFFSLGTSDEYYENLNRIGEKIRNEILEGLNDIAKHDVFFKNAIVENVTRTSLLRNISQKTVTGQFRRIANGGARLTEYKFQYLSPKTTGNNEYSLSFEVLPESSPPTNIHAIIGKNGVGKTRLLNNMINSLIDPSTKQYGDFITEGQQQGQNIFANLVSITFSAFDETEFRQEQIDKAKEIQYYYIGLKRIPQAAERNPIPKSTTILRNEFLESLKACKIEPKRGLWKEAIKILEFDTIFKDSEVKGLIDIEAESKEYKTLGADIFKRLSSGHKIILLTITRLIETVQEKTLVLIDEPEAHLHPPLLSAFVRTLSDLLIKTNGVAIIATHSPVILQEIPKSCAWKLRRVGVNTVCERLAIESFGENVGILTNEVFGLEVTTSGFYKMLADQVKEGKSYKEIISYFGDQLGMEARAILMALINNKENS